MPLIRVQAIMEHDDGLPRDAVVNTFHFQATAESDADELATDVVEFYTTATSGGRWLSDWLSPTVNGVYAKAYVVNDTIVEGKLISSSGEPIVTTLTAAFREPQRQSTEALPSEVAVCLSTRATSYPSVPKARRTGRIYFGPLNIAARQAGAGAIARPTSSLLLDLREMGDRLHDQAIVHNSNWVVYSRPTPGREAYIEPGTGKIKKAIAPRLNGTTYNIDQVWTDDAFDTQRRRGERATAKQTLAV